ncbi:MAG: hypothetical protein ACYDDV_08985 [Methanoregula sp.]
MNRKVVEIVTAILLVGGLAGVLSTIITPQNLNILLLALLPIGLFIQNHQKTFREEWGKWEFLVTPLRYFIFGVLIVGFIVYLIVNWPSVLTPIYMASLTLGLFSANQIYLQKC